MAQEDVLGVHGHVGLELALPPAVGLLALYQVGIGQGNGFGHALVEHLGVCLGHADLGGGPFVLAGGTRQQRHDSRSTTYTARSASARRGTADKRARSSEPRAASR